MKKILIIIAVVLIVLVLVFLSFTLFKKDKEGPDSTSQESDCGDRQVFFTTSPVDLAKIYKIIPLGNLNPPGHTFPTDHIYFLVKSKDESDENSQSRIVDLYAPGDITIIKIGASEHVKAGFTDYSVDFSLCEGVASNFIHVSSLAPKLAQAFQEPFDDFNQSSTGGETYRSKEKRVEIEVSAGEVIGKAGGRQGIFDMGMHDERITPLEYANNDRWREGSHYVACPIDYFVDSVKKKLEARFGGWNDDKRTIKPICGQVDQDIPGTAQGVWFKKGEPSDQGEDQHLALVHDNIDPRKPIFSVGNSITDMTTGPYQYQPKNSGLVNRDFKNITPDGKVYCFKVRGNYLSPDPSLIILQLTDAETLKIEKGSGASCGAGPWRLSSRAQEFVR